MCRKGRTLSPLEEICTFMGRKYMLRSASVRICVTDTQACARATLVLLQLEITAKYPGVRTGIFRASGKGRASRKM